MNKSEVLEIFEKVLEEWFSAELILLSQGGDGTDDLEIRKELYRQRFIEALNKE
ncbi:MULTISPECIES: hypothetical protein [Bacillus]|uniref:hypothetical protein n=1 Tax=Bacillus TaxID=1386 RepID=UPI000A8E283B|nr:MULTISPECIES: hypothetical protein [Bacillus]MEC0497225.1 hypothetical protein [Bacillus glycinifermentans]MEC0539556.1 hypothetical protein [Bacillus glycinifermentans]